MSNSVDPDETAQYKRLIRIYAFCEILVLLPLEVKELKLDVRIWINSHQ